MLTPDWNGNGNPIADDDGRVIDELWHATINSRGQFINAKSPDEVTSAMRQVLSAASAANSPSGTLALTGARIGAGSLTVSPEYQIRNNGTDWSSKLKASQASVDPKQERHVLPRFGRPPNKCLHLLLAMFSLVTELIFVNLMVRQLV